MRPHDNRQNGNGSVADRAPAPAPGVEAMADPDVYERAVDYWRTLGVPLLAPGPPDEVGATFEALGYPLSSDVRRLYGVTGGFVDYASDAGFWSLWSLARLYEQNERGGGLGGLLCFADYSIRAHTYAFHYEGAGVSSVTLVDDGQRIADSLEGFLETYLSDPDAVYAFR